MSRGRTALLLIALLPVVAHAPAWWEGRLLGPGDGAALHLGLRTEVWRAYRHGELPGWNPSAFSGTPLLAAYRPGALYPAMPPLAALDPFTAFQCLVLVSLSLSGVLLFVYLRRLGAARIGAYLGALGFCLGPYLVGHLGDTATVVAAPALVLLLLAAEDHMRRSSPGRAAGLAAALALLLLAGSPEATGAGLALLVGRLVVGHAFGAPNGPRVISSLRATAAGVLLAAPQLVPTLLALPEAGRQVAGFADGRDPLPGITGLIVRYVSHTPAPALAVAALPLMLRAFPVRVLGVALGLCVALQWGRGPLAAPGALALVFDLTLAILAGLSLSAQWRARRRREGRRLRAYFLFASLASAAALSVAAAALGPLPQTLAGAVGVLALAHILYFSLAAHPDRVVASVFLLPLSVAFVLQPHGRATWADAPTRADLDPGTPTRQGVERVLGQRATEPVLTLSRHWPAAPEDLAYAGYGALSGRRGANGYDPMVPLRTRRALAGAGPDGSVSGALLRTDPGRLEFLGVRWVQVPSEALVARPESHGLGDRFDRVARPGQPLFFPVPLSPATEIRVGSWLSQAEGVLGDTPVARVWVRLASGRRLEVPLRAGADTAEWAWERPDVARRIAHRQAPLLETWRAPEGFAAHRYLGTLTLPGRYLVDGIQIEALPDTGQLAVAGLGLYDSLLDHVVPVSLASAFVSDTGRFREALATPGVRLFELTGSLAPARVVPSLSVLPDDDAVLDALGHGRARGWRAADTALASAADQATPVTGGTPGRVGMVRSRGGSLELRAEGPGVLVTAVSWDPGWSGTLDSRPTPVLRVNHARLGMALGPGTHRVTLDYRIRGLAPGLALAVCGVLLAAAPLLDRRPRSG